MKLIRKISRDEMIGTFILGELESPDRKDDINKALSDFGYGREIITNPNYDDLKENQARQNIFNRFRGDQRPFNIYKNFSNDVEWYDALFDMTDYSDLYHVDLPEYGVLSGQTLKVIDGARNVSQDATLGLRGLRGMEPVDVRVREIVNDIKSGKQFEKIIIVTRDKKIYVVLEGNKRASAYCVVNNPSMINMTVVLGISENIARWSWWPKRFKQ